MRGIASGCCGIITIILCITTGWQGVGATLIDALNRSRYLLDAMGIHANLSPRAPRPPASTLIMRPILLLLVAAAGCSHGAPTPEAAPTSGEPGLLVDHHVHAFGPEVFAAANRRALGIERIVFGTDWPEWTAEAYRADLSTHLPLTPEEFAVIDRSRAPWFR